MKFTIWNHNVKFCSIDNDMYVLQNCTALNSDQLTINTKRQQQGQHTHTHTHCVPANRGEGGGHGYAHFHRQIAVLPPKNM